nr:immunoglobulin heavy chain junction region [Mus musculus]
CAREGGLGRYFDYW